MPLPILDEESERELKILYRKACSLCHPDKAVEDNKEAAHSVFVELQEAYKCNDLYRLREIYEAVMAGGITATRSSTLTQAEKLKAAIAELEYAITRLVAELKTLQETDGVRLMEAAGATETDWQNFFAQQETRLEMELARIVIDIQVMHSVGLPK